MMEGETNSDRRKKTSADQFIDNVFSWSLEDISNENLYKEKVSYLRTLVPPCLYIYIYIYFSSQY